jgi:hypothetical protein
MSKERKQSIRVNLARKPTRQERANGLRECMSSDHFGQKNDLVKRW